MHHVQNAWVRPYAAKGLAPSCPGRGGHKDPAVLQEASLGALPAPPILQQVRPGSLRPYQKVNAPLMFNLAPQLLAQAWRLFPRRCDLRGPFL